MKESRDHNWRNVMSLSPGFFDRRSNQITVFTPDRPHLPTKHVGHIDLNGQGVSALAITIIDHFLAPTRRGDDELAKIILTHLLYYFPHHPRLKDVPDFLTPAKYLQQLCLQPDLLTTLIELLSLTLKHIAIDYILTHPDNYHDLFNHPAKLLHAEALQNDRWGLNPWIVHALANSLPLNIILHETQDKKNIARRYSWSHQDTLSSQVIMHWQGNQCKISAHVEFSNWFKALTPLSIQIPPLSFEMITAFSKRAQEQTIQLEKRETRLLEKYHLIQQRLNNMITKQHLSETDVLTLYLQSFTPQQDALRFKRPMNTQYGSQYFFECLKSRHSNFAEETFAPIKQNTLLDGLTDALARAITLGDINDITQKMKHIEELPTQSKFSAF